MNFNNFNDFINFFSNYNQGNQDRTTTNASNSNDSNESNGTGKCEFDPTAGASSNYCRDANSDIPGGFQDVDPQLFVVIGEILGLVLGNNMPFNVQNSFGNWLQLVGQAILTYNAQQQYFMGGPGRYYGPQYRNVNNPFYVDNADESGIQQPASRGGSNSSNDNSNNSNSSEISDLKKMISKLQNEIKDLRKEVNEIKRDK